jgi:hypothetical protein
MLNHRRGGFTILDNGVAEAKPASWDELEKMARQYHVNELILPDVMGDAKATRAAVDAVFDDAWHHTNPYGLMGVVQGTNTNEIIDLIRYYLGMQGRTLTSIGLPRCLIDTFDLAQARAMVAHWIRNEDERIPIHLLGTNPNYINELKDFGRNFRAMNVRGVDTSAPFVYAAAGKWIGDSDIVARPDNYFDLERADFDDRLLDMNIATLGEWVHG